MKRSAERQLTKDDEERDETGEGEPEQGFKKADESILARRPMKGLPRRSLAGALSPAASPPPERPAPPTPSATEVEPPPKFVGFSGFGSSAPTSTSFSFSTSTPKPQTTTPSIRSGFSSGRETEPPVSAAATSNGPSVASSASAATKTFASFLGKSSETSAPYETSQAAPSDANDDAVREEAEYYIALRGLNQSLLSAVSKAVESDPFVDITDVLERYRDLRVSVKADYDERLRTSRKTNSGTRSAPPSSSSTLPSSEDTPITAPSNSAFMPKPPSAFSGFGPSTNAMPSSQNDSTKNGKTDEKSSSFGSTGFSFGSSASSSTESSSTSAPPAPPKSAFTFGSSGGSSMSFPSSTSLPFGSANAPAQATFTFGKTTTSSPSKSGDDSSSSSTTTTPFTFGTSSSSTFSSNFFGKPADKDKQEDKSASFTFNGSGSTPGTSVFGGASAFGTPEKLPSSTALTFGSGSPSKPSLFGGFGKVGSIGNPVGFAFGSPPKTPDGESPSNKPSTSFSFAAPPKADSSLATTDDHASGASTESTPAPDAQGEGQPQLMSTSLHDQEGEGEEDEVTTHEIRSKVFKMLKKDGKNEWSDMGVGVLRLKKHKENDTRRMLLRNSSTGKITINFIIYSGMNASVSRNVVSFIGHDEGASTPFRIRTKTEDQANALKSALDREIEFVRGKSETS